MIKLIFSVVAQTLYRIAKALGLTYNEVNILVYYLIIPLSWTIMFDCWLGMPLTTFALAFIWVGIFIATRHTFRQWCDWAFQDSVYFLDWFNSWGGNYVLNSVIICVLIPILVYAVLFMLLLKF